MANRTTASYHEREDIILDILLGSGDESELEGLSDDENVDLTKDKNNELLILVNDWDDEETEEVAKNISGLLEDENVVHQNEVRVQVGEENVHEQNEVAEEQIEDNMERGTTPPIDEINQNNGAKKTTRTNKRGRPTGLKIKSKINANNFKRKKKDTAPKNKSKPRNPPKMSNWEERKFSCKVPSVETGDMPTNPPILTPLQYFKVYYNDDFFINTAECTNIYCLTQNGRELNTDAKEIKTVYGMHMLMGCLKYPRMRMYWSAGYALVPIQKAMSRDRFVLLRNCLHVVNINNPPPQRNRLWKVQPVLNAVKTGCDNILREPGNYSIDEQMVPFLGRTSLKQYVAKKPRPVGLKNFVITTSEGIMVDFEMYQGKQSNLPMMGEMGLGPSVVMRLKDSAPPLSVLYFDRYFTTIGLMEKLFSLQYYATGTLNWNRLHNIEFTPGRKMERGEFEERISSDGNVAAIKWMDNKSVVMLSTVCGSEPATLVKRWSKKDKQFVNVECPASVVTYNKNMGGVDTLNQLIEVYRTWFRQKNGH